VARGTGWLKQNRHGPRQKVGRGLVPFGFQPPLLAPLL